MLFRLTKKFWCTGQSHINSRHYCCASIAQIYVWPLIDGNKYHEMKDTIELHTALQMAMDASHKSDYSISRYCNPSTLYTFAWRCKWQWDGHSVWHNVTRDTVANQQVDLGIDKFVVGMSHFISGDVAVDAGVSIYQSINSINQIIKHQSISAVKRSHH